MRIDQLTLNLTFCRGVGHARAFVIVFRPARVLVCELHPLGAKALNFAPATRASGELAIIFRPLLP